MDPAEMRYLEEEDGPIMKTMKARSIPTAIATGATLDVTSALIDSGGQTRRVDNGRSDDKCEGVLLAALSWILLWLWVLILLTVGVGGSTAPLLTIESPDGDIVDCIIREDQPAFQNPVLKNHKIHESTSGITKKAEIKYDWQVWHKNGTKCPKGSIPIRRVFSHHIGNSSSNAGDRITRGHQVNSHFKRSTNAARALVVRTMECVMSLFLFDSLISLMLKDLPGLIAFGPCVTPTNFAVSTDDDGVDLEMNLSRYRPEEYDFGDMLNEHQMAKIKKGEELSVERDKEIQQVVESVNDLAQIMKDVSVLVIDQGTIVDRIDYNTQNVATTVEDGLKQLQKAERTQRHGEMVMCASVLVILCFIMLLFLILKEIVL